MLLPQAIITSQTLWELRREDGKGPTFCWALFLVYHMERTLRSRGDGEDPMRSQISTKVTLNEDTTGEE